MGPAMVKVNVRGGATRAMRNVIAFAARSVTRAGFGRAVTVGGALWPNPAVERTCRGSASFSFEPLWRHAAHLVRWASWR